MENQELIVEAAATGNKEVALQALFNDPLVRNLDSARAIFDDLLAAHAEHLPQFRG
jgi:alpha-galactosidase/6-phospho-beta-glucosidase family protein